MSDAPKLVVHCYPWYIADWLQSEHVAAMSLEERGLYREALDLCYANGSIPDNPVALQKLTRSTEKEFRRAWPKVRQCFYQDGDRLCNEKVNAVLEKERVRRERARESGSAGGRAKAQKTKQEPSEQASKEGSKNVATLLATLGKNPSEIVAPQPHPPPHPPPQPHPPPLAPKVRELLPVTPEPKTQAWLAEHLVERHPKKGDRSAVESVLDELLFPLLDEHRVTRIELIDNRHIAWCEQWVDTNTRYIPKLSNWLRDGGWRDSPEPTEDYESKLPPLHDGRPPE